MDKNTYLQRNQQLINKYEKQLTSFGRKVMKSLIDIKFETDNKTYKCINMNDSLRRRNKKVIIFNDSNDITPTINNTNIKSDEISQSQNQNNNLPSVSTSIDLLEAVDKISDKTNKPCPSNENSISAGKDLPQIKIDELHDQADGKGLPWSQIVDTNIFQQLDDSDEDAKSIIDLQQNVSDERNKLVSAHISDVEDNKPYVDICEREIDIKKRKTTVKNKESVKKNIKSLEQKKMNTFRKEKYTKTVKNWLNDVDPANAVEEDALGFKEMSVPGLDSYDTRKVNENSDRFNKKISTSKVNIEKRKIQSLLVNKDGVMRFGKPNMSVGVPNFISKINGGGKNVDNVERADKKFEFQSRVKKIPRFVAPIKSQTLISDNSE